METRLTPRLIKVFKVLVICVVFLVTLQVFILQMSNNTSAEVTQPLFDVSDKRIRTYSQSIRNKTNGTWIVLLAVNFAYFDMFQNWLCNYHSRYLNIPVVVVAEDDKIFRTLNLVYRDTLTVERADNKPDMDGAADFASSSFNKLTSERPAHILRYLEMGYNVLYCDTDAIWIKDPFPHFIGNFDIWAQMDMDDYSTGFQAIQSNTRTLQFIQDWKFYMSGRSDINDQDGYNALNNSMVRIKKLDNTLFPSGHLYFTIFSDDQRSESVIVHNNYILGHDAKIQRFKKFGLWQT